MNSKIIIVGAGGHAISVANIAISNGQSIIGFVDNAKSGDTLLDFPIISTEFCEKYYSALAHVIAIGDNAIRKKVSMRLKQKNPKIKFPNLIHKSATIGVGSIIGEGTVVMPQANIGPKSTIGDFCIINTSSSLDHDCVMGNFGSIAPGVTTGGNVRIGHCSAISIGATIKHDINIGVDSVIGASSYVNKDVADRIISYGRPSIKIRSRHHGESYLT